eukprot:sb/3463303/
MGPAVAPSDSEGVPEKQVSNEETEIDEEERERQELALLGYRTPNWRGATLVDRSRWCNPKFGKTLELRFNPIVAPAAFLLVATFVTWCILDKDAKNKFSTAKTVITSAFTWLYIASLDIWAIVIVLIYASKYGKLKLGNDDEKPEYPEGSWFAMLFACGVGVGLFFYGVSEPVNAGLNFIFPSIEKSITTQVIIIWIITAIATISVVTGVGAGVRRLSEICFGVGMFLMMSTFFLEDSWYLLNLYVQTIGYYFQTIVKLGFRTDAFELLNITSSSGKDRGRSYKDGEYDAPENWMNSWTIFYWGWWISWSPFVGMFIAKISRGRTIRQFINGTLTAPMIYSFLWLTIFGGSAMYHEKAAAAVPDNKYCCVYSYSSISWDKMTDLSEFDGLLKGVEWPDYHNRTNCTVNFKSNWEAGVYGEKNTKTGKEAVEDFMEFYKIPSNQYKMAVSEDRGTARLSCLQNDDQWFALMYTKGKLGVFLSIVSLFGIVLYFVTSADSGSLVIDIMAANGDQNPPRAQRIFWAFSEGAAATALLWAGGNDALIALQIYTAMEGKDGRSTLMKDPKPSAIANGSEMKSVVKNALAV